MDVDRNQLQKLNLLLTYGGVLVPRNGTGKVHCIGGETRMVSFFGKADVTFSKLHSKIFDLFYNCKPYPDFLLLQYLDPYAPPNLMDDRPSLVRITNDGDVRRMVEVNERAVAEGKKEGRIRVFVWERAGIKDGGLGFVNGGVTETGDLGGSWGRGDLGGRKVGEEDMIVGFRGDHSNNPGIGAFKDCGRRPVRIGDGNHGMFRNFGNGVCPGLDSLSFKIQKPPRASRRIPQSIVLGGSDSIVGYEIEGGQEGIANCEMSVQKLKSIHGRGPSSKILNPPLSLLRIVLVDKTSDILNIREQEAELNSERGKILSLPSVKKPPILFSNKIEKQENLFSNFLQQDTPNVLDVKVGVQQEEMKNMASLDKSSCCAANDPIHVTDLDKNKNILKGGKISSNYPELAIQELQIIKNSDLDLIRKLGSGNYGTVFYGKWMGSDVAIKRIKPSFFSGSDLEADRLVFDIWKEAYLMAQLHHPNVLTFYGITTDGPETNLAIITEYMVNGSLKQVLQKNESMDRCQRLIITMDAAFGMLYLHDKNIIHYDLKSQSFLVNMKDSNRPICKIGDLGLSKTKRRALIFDRVRGTISWMAPELLSRSDAMVTEKVDVFSFGIIMWELLTGKEPYENMPFEEIMDGITKGNLRPVIPSWCDPEWRILMERCWSSDPKMRPSFSEIASELHQIAVSMNI